MNGGLQALLLHEGEIYTPEPRGRGSVLLVDGKIAAVGALRLGDVQRAADALHLDLETLDARESIIAPGLIDPHEHLLGPSGEEGFSSRGPEIFCVELIESGITTVVGTLGTDNTMRTPPELLAKVKALAEEGLSAFMYSGGYSIPPVTLMGSLRNDVMFIDEVIGAGEVAVSDSRAVNPTPRDIASIAIETRVGGKLARKAGVTHLHLGPSASGLQPVIDALNEFELEPAALYPTHITRSKALLRQAIGLARRGAFVDIDTTENDLAECLDNYEREDGPFAQLTVSTDAGGDSPRNLLAQLRDAAAGGRSLDQLLPLVTQNTARALHLPRKGTLRPGCDGDLLVLDRATLTPRYVVAHGKLVLKDGDVIKRPSFLSTSDREVTLSGEKA